MSTSGNLLVNINSYSGYPITMRKYSNDTTPNINFSVVTITPSYFTKYYNQSLSVLKVDMNCARNNYYNPGIYGTQLYVSDYIKTSGFKAYLIFGFLFVIAHLICMSVQICKLDLSKMMCDIKKTEINKYNKILSFIIVEMALSSLTSIHYILYGSMYHMVLQPCL
jgi:hypothetical protein